MNFAYTLVFVADVSASLDFFDKAFGLPRRFLHESGAYGEVDTGASGTTLAFVDHATARDSVQHDYVAADASPLDRASGQVSEAITVLKDVKIGNKEGDDHLEKARTYLARARAELLKAQSQGKSE